MTDDECIGWYVKQNAKAIVKIAAAGILTQSPNFAIIESGSEAAATAMELGADRRRRRDRPRLEGYSIRRGGHVLHGRPC